MILLVIESAIESKTSIFVSTTSNDIGQLGLPVRLSDRPLQFDGIMPRSKRFYII